MKKVYKKVLAFLLIMAVGIQSLQYLGIMKVSGEGIKKLEPGGYFYLDTVFNGGDWRDANAKIFFYCDTNDGWVNVEMERWGELLRVKIPDNMKMDGGFVLRRMNPVNTNLDDWNGNGTSWNQVPGGVFQNIKLNSAPDNCNTYKLSDWAAGGWAAGTWNISNYGGRTMYLMNMDADEPLGESIKAEFSVSSTGGKTNRIMSVRADLSCMYSVTIPDDDNYDSVTFYDSAGTILSNAKILDGSFEPDTANTFYYKRTIKSNGDVISNWDAYPSGTGNIEERKLYLNKYSFPVYSETAPVIRIGNRRGTVMERDSQDEMIYSYTIPAASGANQQTILSVTSDGNIYRFLWSDLNNNLLGVYEDTGKIADNYVAGVEAGKRAVYFDATLSKLVYTQTSDGTNGGGDYGIPNRSGTIRYYATGSGIDVEGDMTRVPDFTVNGHRYSDVYVAYLPEGYNNIAFSNFDMSNSTNYGWGGESTRLLTIPDSLVSPCFYADTSDDYIYNSNANNQRSGYWDELGRVRDPEKEGGGEHTVVDIPRVRENRDNNRLYLSTTFYDFYSDYELNGKNRDNYDYQNLGHRIYQPFRQFDQALSEYYRSNNALHPLYWGNFQNYSGAHFNDISWDLSLFGSDNSAKLFYENNSMWGIDGSELSNGQNATLGLVSNTLDDDGNLMIETSGGTVAAPFFDKDYLSGNNTKNTVLGKVYENVTFPFKKKAMQSSSGSSGTVDYWYFDSKESDNNLRLTQDTVTGRYYLNPSTEVVKGKTTDSVTESGNFFPFNGSGQSGNSGKLNYGFGTKFELEFKLTDSGTVLDSNGREVPIEFNFSGDDDIWIFIDGKLALDLGGDHGIVTGTLDFKNKRYTISSVKNQTSGGSSANQSGTFSIEGDNSDEHVLTLFYMERGLWESNMFMSFNFPDNNSLEVEKEVDDSDVNEMFKELNLDYGDFEFEIENWATHYESEAETNNGENRGFVIQQYDISDYGSIAAKGLVHPDGAYYYKTNARADEQQLDSTGIFTLTDKEKAVFINQFRLGSYIALKEINVNTELFDTTWTMYDNDEPVILLEDGDTVELGDITSLKDVRTLTVNDGRKEVYQTGMDNGHSIANSGYTASSGRPSEAFVFRSFLTPDNEVASTKLKAVYKNKVKTGSLTIRKDKASENEVLDGHYTFEIVFYNIAGLGGTETVTKRITLDLGNGTREETITGIPINTQYTIKEIETSDNSTLQGVYEGEAVSADYDAAAQRVAGTITTEKSTPAYTFKNTKKPVIDISVQKLWKDVQGNSLTAGIPDSVTVQLQRRPITSDNVNDWMKVLDNVILTSNESWKHTFAGLDEYVDYTQSDRVKWQYQVVEVDNDSTLEEGDFINKFKVSYSYDDIQNIQTITNTYIPDTKIKITKVDASAPAIKLSDVSFKLEKLSEDNSIDSGFTALTATTDSEGIAEFTDLPDGTYRLTETAAKSGYSLLKAPIIVVIDRSEGGCTVDDKTITVGDDDTISITVSNRKKFELPSTGGHGRTIVVLAGLVLIWLAGLTYIIKKGREKCI